MNILTRTLEWRAYGTAIFVVYGLSSSSLASMISSYWRRDGDRGLTYVHSYVLTLVAVLGLFLVPLPTLLGTLSSCLISIPIGITIGFIASISDHKIVRSLVRPRLSVRRTHGTPAISGARRTDRRNSYFALGVIALFEEIIYRGVFIHLCYQLPSGFLTAVGISCLVVAFCLAHLYFGWEHVIAKLPLSAMSTGAVLIFHTIAGGVTAHVVFNLLAVRDDRRAER